jgi:hypothetical protein
MSDPLTNTEQTPFESPDNFNSILIGAGVIFLFGVTPYLNLTCCLGITVGGAVAVWHYVSQHSLSLSNGEGFKLGALAGLLGGLATLVVSYALLLLAGYQPGQKEVQDLMLSIFGNDPAVRAQMELQMREQSANALSAGNIAVGVIATAIVNPLFAGLGGVISASAFKKGAQPSQ